MFIQNAVYKAIPTDGLTFPLAEGTVITVGDVTGIVPENIALAAPTGLIYLATGGTIDLTSEANAGVSFTDAEMNSLGGDFNFVPKAESSGLPPYTSADKGKVLTIGDASPVETEVVVFAEQTVEFSRGGSSRISTATTFDMFAAGSTGTLTIDGTSYPLEWFEGGFKGDENAPVVRWFSADSEWGIKSAIENPIADGNHTVSFTATASVTPSETTVIVPEQTMAVSGSSPSPVVGADSSAFVVGTTAVLVAHAERLAGGGEYTLTCVEQEGIMGFAGEGAPLVFFLYEGSVLVRGSSDTWTFSLTRSVPSVEPKWEAASGGTFIVTDNDGGLDKTAGDIMSALTMGKDVVISHLSDVPAFHYARFYLVNMMSIPNGQGDVFAVSYANDGTPNMRQYHFTDSNDYPAISGA